MSCGAEVMFISRSVRGQTACVNPSARQTPDKNLLAGQAPGRLGGMEATYTLGEISDRHGFLRLQLRITDAMGMLIIFCCDDKTHTKSGYLTLDAQRWATLKAIIAKADATIDRLKKSGELRYVADGFYLAGEAQ